MKVLNIILCGGLIVWQGFILSKLWAWFLVPIFGAPELGCAGAIGCGAVLSTVVYSMKKTDATAYSDREMFDMIWHRASLYATLLLIGYLAQLFM